MSLGPKNVVLLAAGRGTRLSALTEKTHKSLLPVAGVPVLELALEAIFSVEVEDIVIVTGDKRESIERFVRERYGSRVRTVANDLFASDTNILSTELGVSALREPEAGYLIVETDVVMAPECWQKVLQFTDPCRSFWVTRGQYGPSLTGGALKAETDGNVSGIVYAPRYDPAYDGWSKLVGLLYVGSDQVKADRAFRQQGISCTLRQYYMTPWEDHLPSLPCQELSLGDGYAASYNDLEAYQKIDSMMRTHTAWASRPRKEQS